MALNALKEACSDESKNLLELSIDAAKARCTVGEITQPWNQNGVDIDQDVPCLPRNISSFLEGH